MQRKPLVQCLRAGAYLLDLHEAEGSYTARKPSEIVDRIAIIDVSGVLVADAGWWDGWGAASYRRISSEILGAVESAEVDGILLRIDSPGGETDGAFETASAIANAAKKKPVWALADVAAYSAAYLIGSSAGKLFAAPESGGLGSIGVYAVHMDYSKYLQEVGIKPTIIDAGDGKTNGNPFEPLSRSARQEIQQEVGRLYEMFVAAVAVGRKLDPEVIRNEIGARTYHGGESLVRLGLADDEGTLESVMKSFRAHLDARNTTAKNFAAYAAAPAARTTKEATMAVEQTSQAGTVKASGEAIDVEAIRATARQEGEKAGYDNAFRIVSACLMAGQPIQQAFGYLKAGKQPGEVERILVDAKAEAAGSGTTEVVSGVKPGTNAADEAGASLAGDPKPDGGTLMKAMENLGKGAF